MGEHPTSAELRERLADGAGFYFVASDAIDALAACEAERDRYRAALEKIVSGNEDCPGAAFHVETAGAALRGDA